MAYAKYGVKSPEWWKHLKEAKRRFWKKVRKSSKQGLKNATRQFVPISS